MAIVLQFGANVSQATQDAATSLVDAINQSGIYSGSKTITVSNFSSSQLVSIAGQTGNTNGANNSQIQINQNFDYASFNAGFSRPAVSLSGSILHELTHALYPGAAGPDNNVHAAGFYIDELKLANAIGAQVDYSDVSKAEEALQRDQGLSANDAQNAIAAFPSAGIQPTGQVTGSHINYIYGNDGVDPAYVQSISTYDANGVLSGTEALQGNGTWTDNRYSNGVLVEAINVDATGQDSNATYYSGGSVTSQVTTSIDGTSGLVTASITNYNSSGGTVSEATATPDSNGDGGSSIRFATPTEAATLNGSSVDASQIYPNGDGSFTLGAPQADTDGLANQLTVNGSFGLGGLSVTNSTTGITSTVTLDNGSSTTLQEGRSVATDAPNEQALTTESNGQVEDAIFGQGATADLSGAKVTLEQGAAATVDGNTDTIGLDSGSTLSANGNSETVTGSHDTVDFGSHDTGETIDGSNDTINLTKRGDDSVTVDGSDLDVTGDTVNNVVDLSGNDTSATVHGGAYINIDGDDDTLTATGTASISVGRRFGGVTIYASDASIYIGNYASATIWGDHDTISHGTGAEISGSYYATGGGGARSYGNGGDNYGDGGSDGGGSYSSDDFAHNAAALKKKPSLAHTSAATSAETAAAGSSGASTAASTASTSSTSSTTHTSTLTQSDMAEVRARRAAQGTSEAGAATTPKFEGPKWVAPAQTTAAGASAAPTITWSFATGPAGANDPFSSYLSSAYKATIEKAFAAWAKASGLTFEEVPDAAASDIRIGWGDLGTSTSGVLGTTTLSDANGAITSAVIRLEDPSLTTMKTGAKGQEKYAGTGATLYQVALHEIGHALGLADDSDPNSVMFASSSKANRKLDATDVKGIQSLYGSTLTQAQTSTISSTPSSAAATGVNQLVQAMSTFDPPQTAPSLTALVTATTVTTPTLATPASR